MNKYQALIEKIQVWQKDAHYSTFNFSQAEKALLKDLGVKQNRPRLFIWGENKF